MSLNSGGLEDILTLVIKSLATACINALTLNVVRIYNPRLNTDSPLGVTANNRSESRTRWNWHLSTTLIPTLQNKQTNKQTQMVSTFKVPKGETKVWAIATATVPRGMKVNKHQVERAKLFTQLGIKWFSTHLSIMYNCLFLNWSRSELLLYWFALVNANAFQCTIISNSYPSVLQTNLGIDHSRLGFKWIRKQDFLSRVVSTSPTRIFLQEKERQYHCGSSLSALLTWKTNQFIMIKQSTS